MTSFALTLAVALTWMSAADAKIPPAKPHDPIYDCYESLLANYAANGSAGLAVGKLRADQSIEIPVKEGTYVYAKNGQHSFSLKASAKGRSFDADKNFPGVV